MRANKIPQTTSIKKCCFKVSVEIEIKIAQQKYNTLKIEHCLPFCDNPTKKVNNQENVT